MKPQLDNTVMSSFYLWFDNTITRKGEAFANHSGHFYPVDSYYNTYYTYASAFRPLVCDHSIPNADIMTGVYIETGDGEYNFVVTGQNKYGFSGINYDQGELYFTGDITSGSYSGISGNFAIKEFSIHLTDESDENLLIETKFHKRPKVHENPTGLSKDEITYPAIFLRNDGSRNEPLAFGGIDQTYIDVRAIVFAESQFQLDAVCSIMRDSRYDFMPVMSESEMPFNGFGDYRDGKKYDYQYWATGQHHGGTGMFYIEEVYVQRFPRGMLEKSSIVDVNPDIYFASADFTLTQIRRPRA